ncbi:MAG: hypothetical protein PHY29_12080 [Syntrophales bacterium]|nr:hypothetical protein [Syntrophales bacterium]
MEERKLVKIKSDNPAHPKGYYIQFADRVKPGDVEYKEAANEEPAEPIKQKRKRK